MNKYENGYYIGKVPPGLCDDIYPGVTMFLCIRDKFYIPGCQGAFSPNEDWMQMVELTRLPDAFFTQGLPGTLNNEWGVA